VGESELRAKKTPRAIRSRRGFFHADEASLARNRSSEFT
jgi:hypothetical protein